MIERYTRELLLFFVAFLILLIGIFVFAIYDIQAKNIETSNLLNNIEQSSENEILMQSVRIIQERHQAEIASLEETALSTDDLITLIEEIESTGHTLGLTVSIVSVGEVVARDGGLPRIRIVLDVEGRWGSIFSMVRAIENLPHKVTVEDIRMSNGELGWQAGISFSMHLFESKI